MKRTVYGVDKFEVDSFVKSNGVVKFWLQKFSTERSRFGYARELCRYFKWLRLVKGIKITPKELLNEQLRLSKSLDLEERKKHLCLALEFSRDNPDLAEKSDSRKLNLFTVIRSFYNYHEVPLTKAHGVFGKRQKRKHRPRQMSIDDARKVLGVLGQRERAICICMLQSGMSIGDVLEKFNFMFSSIYSQIVGGAERIKILFDDRKGNNFTYFTFISVDAIHELKKWFLIRKDILEAHGKKHHNAIFLTRTAKPLDDNAFQNIFRRKVLQAGLKKAPFEVTPHMFRKLFKTESRPPERGIDQDCIEFMMGHISGIESVGGVYDRTPELYEGVIEKEYAKLEPYINIYSGKTANIDLKQQWLEIKQMKKKIAELTNIVNSLPMNPEILMKDLKHRSTLEKS